MRVTKPFQHIDGHLVAGEVPAGERLLLEVLDTVREPLLVLDDAFRVTHANREFYRVFRVGAPETIGRVFFELGDAQWDIPQLRTITGGGTASRTRVTDVDVEREFPGIGRRTMLINATLIQRGPNAARMILVAIEDITERRHADRRIADQQLELTRSNAALNEFAYVASHDLQEPLRKILSFGERLETTLGDTLQGESRRHLDRVLDAATRMRTLIDDLLTYSQVTTRLQPFAPTDLGVVAREVVADLESTITASGGRVELGDLPVIEADAPQMRRLFQNLVANSLKYRQKETPPVVRLSSAKNGGNTYAITVADNGIGFNQVYADKIFKMFERLHNRAQFAGSGIGLAICRRIVERHGGTIAASSTSGQGATFTVTLPFTQSAPGSTS